MKGGLDFFSSVGLKLVTSDMFFTKKEKKLIDPCSTVVENFFP